MVAICGSSISAELSSPNGLRSMPLDSKPSTNASHWLLRRADQVALVVAVVLCLTAIAFYWLHQGGAAGRMVDVRRAEPLHAGFQVDPNSAYWYELAQIPDIGESLGRRIVAEREQHGPFADHYDLQHRVSGIGPKTIEKMSPYLLPMPPRGTVVEGRGTEVEKQLN